MLESDRLVFLKIPAIQTRTVWRIYFKKDLEALENLIDALDESHDSVNVLKYTSLEKSVYKKNWYVIIFRFMKMRLVRLLQHLFNNLHFKHPRHIQFSNILTSLHILTTSLWSLLKKLRHNISSGGV